MIETLAPQAPRTVTYAYDAQYRLTGESTSGFSQALTYDPAGNRTKLTRVEGATTTVTTYACDTLNRLLTSTQTINGGAAATTIYAYDLNGNQTSQTIPGRPVITMVWDTLNRLVGGNVFGLTAGLGQSYDYRTRRQTKANATTVTFFRYDQGDSFQELQSTAMQVEFVRGSGMGGGIGSILYSDRTMAGGSEETFTYNPSVGNVVALTNGIGATTETNRFDAFGNVIAASGTSLNNRLANTKERDISIPGVFTLDNHGFRYYNPITGRYISRDPVGYADGANLYAYVHNNPINKIDPLGLYDIGGHFYTTYVVALACGMPPERALHLAYYSQMPDQYKHTDACGPMYWTAIKAIFGNERAQDVQKGQHFLEMRNEAEINSARSALKANVALDNYALQTGGGGGETGLRDLGMLIHLFGDSYAHTQMKDGHEVGHEAGLGHGKDGHAPDMITHSEFTRAKYEKYLDGLISALGDTKNENGRKLIKDYKEFIKGLHAKYADDENGQISKYFREKIKILAPGAYDPEGHGLLGPKEKDFRAPAGTVGPPKPDDFQKENKIREKMIE